MGMADKLAAEQLKDLEAYQSARRIGGIGKVYLNANESPHPAFHMPAGETWQRYPDFLPEDLARRYAEYAGVAAEQVIATRGADEGIDLLLRGFCEPDRDAVVLNPPTYAMYDFIAAAHRVETIEVPLTSDFALNVPDNVVAAARAKLVFLCNPNNPTGNALGRDQILALADRLRDQSLVVVDEAYSEYCPDESVVDAIATHPNLIVLRTLSKAFSLAAVRIGFVLAAADVITLIAKLIAPYPIPDPCARIALDALGEEGLDWMATRRDSTVALRANVAGRLAELSCVERVYPSVTNFLLVKFRDAGATFSQLKRQGIILRDQTQAPGLADHLRISIGAEQEMEQLLDCLTEMD